MLPNFNQKGISQILLPLFLVAAIGLSVYLVQQRTNLIPFAQQNQQPPLGCSKITTSIDTREVQWEDLNDNTDGPFRKSTMEKEGEGALLQQQTWQKYAFKKVRWTWTGGWKDTGKKIWAGDSGQGPNYSAPNGDSVQWDRVGFGSAPTRFESPDGKIYYGRGSNAPITGAGNDGIIREVVKAADNEGAIVVFSKFIVGTNYQGVTTNPDGTPAKKFEPNGSYAFVPDNPKAGTDCSKADGGGATGSKNNGDACENTQGSQCKSGICTNSKCVQGTKKGQESCRNREECESNICTNGKCAGGSKGTGQACDGPEDCASNRCGADKKCQARTTTNNTTNNTTSNRTTNTSNNPGNTSNRTGGNDTGGNNTSGNNTTGTPVTNTTPATNTTPGTAAPVTLTKAEITGFKASFDAFYPRLGTAKDTGNLKVVSTIANTELASIVAELPTCPDDANVGTCVDSKFRRRFDLAKTAARLSAFYATFNNIPGICVKADLGINPLISATSQAGTSGRVNLCTDRLVASRIWMVFAGGKFVPVLSTDTKYIQNPTCANLPADVLTHFHQAESLFKTQAGFVENTVCDGKTTVAPGGEV